MRMVAVGQYCDKSLEADDRMVKPGELSNTEFRVNIFQTQTPPRLQHACHVLILFLRRVKCTP